MNSPQSHKYRGLLPWAEGYRPQRLPSEQDRRIVRSAWKKSEGLERATLGSLLAQIQAAKQDYDDAIQTIQYSRKDVHEHAHMAHAILDWAHTTVLSHQGQLNPSRKSFASLQRRLSSISAWGLLAPMCLSRARQMLVRGGYEEASLLAHNARNHARQAEHNTMVIEALGVSCEIALATGKQRDADQYLQTMEQLTEASPAKHKDSRRFVALTRASLAMTQGLFQQSEDLLNSLQPEADPLLQIALNQRMAELHLRQGRLSDAELLVRQNLASLEAFGQRAALGVGIRILGDIQALRHEPNKAVGSYILALQTGCLCSDFHNAKQACSRIIAVEQLQKSSPRGAQFESIYRDLEELTAPPFELTR